MVNHLRLASHMLGPWISIRNNNTHDCYGIQCNLVKYLAKSLNFTFELIQENDGNGHQWKNGTWTGMVAKYIKNVSYLLIVLCACLNNLFTFDRR